MNLALQLVSSGCFFQDVVASKYQIPLAMMETLIEKAGEDFLNKVTDAAMEIEGPLTYYLEPMNEENVWVHFMMPVKELVLKEGNVFLMDSYYSQEQVVCVRAQLEELKQFDQVLQFMEDFCKPNQGMLYGPVYYVASVEEKEPYVILKRGVLLD